MAFAGISTQYFLDKRFFSLAVAGILCYVAYSLFTFSNVTDMLLLYDVPWAFDLYMRVHHQPDRYLISHNCDELGHDFSADLPILFKGCVTEPPDVTEYMFYPESRQNLFVPCEPQDEPTRQYNYTGVQGDVVLVKEKVPCSNRTLREKVEFHNNLAEDARYYDVHTVMLGAEERAHVKSVIESKLKGKKLWLQNSNNIIGYFMQRGMTAVYYMHAHMDSFMSINVKGKKRWYLINPRYHSVLKSKWTGVARIVLGMTVEVPKMDIMQEVGDILYVPPWWVHTTRLTTGDNISVNVHWIVEKSVLGALIKYTTIFFGPAWFYTSFA